MAVGKTMWHCSNFFSSDLAASSSFFQLQPTQFFIQNPWNVADISRGQYGHSNDLHFINLLLQFSDCICNHRKPLFFVILSTSVFSLSLTANSASSSCFLLSKDLFLFSDFSLQKLPFDWSKPSKKNWSFLGPKNQFGPVFFQQA